MSNKTEIKSRSELLEHPSRDILTNIIYEGTDMLNEGDLPNGGNLKEIQFVMGELSLIKGSSIPESVEIITFGYTETIPSPEISDLPLSVHTLRNVNLPPNAFNNYKDFKIPSNIKSISFCNCPIVSSKDNGSDIKGEYITLPNTLQEVHFDGNWTNHGRPLNQGDFPESLIKLTIFGFSKLKLTKNSKGIIPNSVKELMVSVECYSDLRQYLPSNLELLSIHYPFYNESKGLFSNLFKDNLIYPNSIPSTVTELHVLGYPGKIEKNIIPNGVKKFEINFLKANKGRFVKGSIPSSVVSLGVNIIIDQPDILPPSLKSLTLREGRDQGISNINKMIALLPNSLTSIELPKKSKEFITKLPSTITDVQYVGFEKLVLKEIDLTNVTTDN